MDCPVCKDVTLVMSERHGIEIDYCPRCRGVWLDRGELDKIIERASPQATPMQASTPPQPQRHSEPSHHGGHGQQGYPPHYKKKREGFLSDLFDFD